MRATFGTTLLLLSLSSCAASRAPAMSPRADGQLGAHAPGTARFVFTRRASSCDSFDHAVVVDERGAFLGALAPNTAFAVDVPPGRHAFFVWPGMDLRSAARPDFEPVGVFDADASADDSRVLDVVVSEPPQGRGHCYRYAIFHFENRANDVAAALAKVHPVEADTAAGQAYLREHREVSAAYFTMAHDRLDRQRAARAADEKRTERVRAAGLN